MSAKKKPPLTLDEAIMHAHAKAGGTPCGREHAQLAEWLTELRTLRAAAADLTVGKRAMEQEADRLAEVVHEQDEAEVNGRGIFRITPDDAILVLNEAVRADPDAVLALMEHRVPCNDDLGDHPTIQVRVINPPPAPPNADATNPAILAPPKTCEVGLLGIINGIFGAYPNGHSKAGWGPIMAEYATAEGPITGFKWTVSPEDEPIPPPSTNT